MQIRRTILAICASLAVFLLWIRISQKLWPEAFQPSPDQQAAQTQPATGKTTTPTATQPAGTVAQTAPGATQPQTAPDSAPADQAELIVEGGTDATPVRLGGADRDSDYPMSVEVLPAGASVGDISLRGYYQTVEKKEHPIFRNIVRYDFQ